MLDLGLVVGFSEDPSPALQLPSVFLNLHCHAATATYDLKLLGWGVLRVAFSGVLDIL